MIPELDKQAISAVDSPIPPEAVRAALDRLVASDAFGKAERPARFLRHLVETALSGQPHLLKESVLGTDVFDRPASWDPRLDPVVRQEAARLRKRIAKCYEHSGPHPEVRIELPVGTYVPVFRRHPAEAPPVDVPPPATYQVQPPQRSRMWPYAAALVLCIIAIAFLAWRVVHRESAISIVVLAFTNLTADPADQYFVDGLTDQTTDSLARLKPLRVIGRSSASLFRKQPHNLADISRQLHVSHVLEASVERSGDRLSVVASLLRVPDGARLWTNAYQRRTADLGAIQADLAEWVRTSLKIAAPDAPAKYIPGNQAHDYYLRARFEAFQATPETNSKAEDDYRRAIEIDPNYALAYSGLASAIWNQNIWANQSPLLEERRKAEELWQKAVQIDPGLAPAHSGLAAYAMQYDWDWKRAERELQAALSSAENSGAESNYAFFCLIRGRRAEADLHRQRANDLDPASPGSLSNYAQFLLVEGRLAEAAEQYRKVVSRNNGLNAKLLLNSVLAAEGQTDVAIRNLLALPQDLPAVQMGLAYAHAKAGGRPEALRILGKLAQNYRDGRLFMNDFAVAYAALDDEPNTVKWMARCLDAREYPAIYIRVDPAFQKFQNSPAFRALRQRMDLDW